MIYHVGQTFMLFKLSVPFGDVSECVCREHQRECESNMHGALVILMEWIIFTSWFQPIKLTCELPSSHR